jgi:hypothetical protein
MEHAVINSVISHIEPQKEEPYDVKRMVQRISWKKGIQCSQEENRYSGTYIKPTTATDKEDSPISPFGGKAVGTIDIDDDLNADVICYGTQQAISYAKALSIFTERTKWIKSGTPVEWHALGIPRAFNEPMDKFENRYYSQRTLPSVTTSVVDFLKNIFSRNVDVKVLLGDDYETRFLHLDEAKDTLIYPRDPTIPKSDRFGKNGSLTGLLNASTMRSLQNGQFAEATVLAVAGPIFQQFRAQLYGCTRAGNDVFQLPPEMFSKTCVTYNLVTDRFGKATASSNVPQLKVLNYNFLHSNNNSNMEVVIPEDAKVLDCALMRPNWDGYTEEHAGFIRVDLESQTIMTFDSMQKGLKEIVTTVQMFLLQYTMHHKLKYLPASDVDFTWTVYDVSSESLSQGNGCDCVMWSLYCLFCSYLEIPIQGYLLSTPDFTKGAFGFCGVGMLNTDVLALKNANIDSHGDFGAFMDRWRLIISYLLSNLSVDGGYNMIAPTFKEVMEAFDSATVIDIVPQVFVLR